MTENTRTFQKPSAVCLIGGGDIMVETARMLAARGIRTFAVIAPRHAYEPLSSEPGTVVEVLGAAGTPCHETEDISDLSSWPHADMPGRAKLALCFGPAWVFPEHVRALFEQGMYNLNLIPQPHYLGGAHYSWQIMNDDRRGACVLQEITARLDRGDIFMKREFEISDAARLPVHYFAENLAAGKAFMADVIDKMVDGDVFEVTSYDEMAKSRLYLPRLLTNVHGIVDWTWTAEEIARFCCAFDRPYPGASTWLNGERVRLRDVSVARDVDVPPMHPFAAGLVLRAEDTYLLVAARGGFLTIKTVEASEGANIVPRIRDGSRFAADPEALDRALSAQAKLSSTGPTVR